MNAAVMLELCRVVGGGRSALTEIAFFQTAAIKLLKKTGRWPMRT
jgi:hypothetical protein